MPLWSAERSRAELIRAVHHLRAETEQDYERYNKASRQSEFNQKGNWQITSDLQVIGSLYDAMAEAIEGVVVHGSPCTQVNRSAWIGLVPLWHKSFVMDELFADVTAKND